MKKKISETMVETLAPGKILWDSTVPGLMVRRSTGRSATWSVYYRTRIDRVQRRPSIGRWPLMSVSDAREAARRLLGAVAAGDDPSGARALAGEERTVDDLAAEMKIRHYPRIKPRSRETYRHALATILAAWKGRRLSTVRRSDVVELHSSLAATPYRANRVLATVSLAWNLAAKWDWREVGDNPARGVDRFPETPRRRVPTPAEVRRIGELIVGRQLTHPDHAAALMLLILTGARRLEVLTARAEWVTARGLELPDSKTGFKVLPLSSMARTVISDLGRESGRLFPCSPTSFAEFWDKLRREAGAPDLRLHDLRRLFASVGLGAGYSLGQIGGVLGHANEATTRRYAWLQTAPATRTAEEIGGEIAGLLARPTPAAVVVDEAEAFQPS